MLGARPGSGRGVRKLWRRAIEFVEPRERGLKVFFVKELRAIDPVAIDGRNADLAPFGAEALSRGPGRHSGDHHSDVAQPMHDLYVDVGLGRDHVPRGFEVRLQVARRERPPSPVVDVHPVRCRRW